MEPTNVVEVDVEAWRTEVDTWHAGRIERLRNPEGWLSLVGLAWIDEGTGRVGSAADAEILLPAPAAPHLGTMTLAGGVVTFAPASDSEVLVDGARLAAPIELAVDTAATPTKLEIGSLRVTLLERSGKFALRVKDTTAPLLSSFTGIDRFPVVPEWRIVARFEPYDPPKMLPVPTAIGTIEDTPSPGAVVFERGGSTYRLDVQSAEPDGSLFVVFGDPTNGKTTYGGGRFVYTAPPAADGTVVLDFNRAYNPPCVFTPYATCPLPLADARFPFAIEAGEKTWGSAAH